MDEATIGSEIRRLRNRKAWTQEQLADVADLSVRTVQRAEEGTLSAETLQTLAAVLDVDVETLSAPAGARVSPLRGVVYYDDPKSLDWLCNVFGFSVEMRIPGPDGKILHAELSCGDAQIIVGQPVGDRGWTTPNIAGARTQSLYVLVDDAAEHCAAAQAAGAKILVEPEDVHGQRRYLAEDCEGHHWWFFAPLRP